MSSSGTRAWRRFLPLPPDETGSLRFGPAHAGRSVLVTGAGGYIGSALVKAIAGVGPRCIVLLDSSGGYGYVNWVNGAGAQPRSGQMVARFTF